MRNIVTVREFSNGASMIAKVSAVLMRAPSEEHHFPRRGEALDDEPDRRRLHAARDVALADAPLAEREVVGENFHAGREGLVQRVAVGPGPAGQYAVLHEVEGDRRP